MFDFDATLPLIALQFIVLAFVLNAIFFKPLTKVLDERASYILNNETEAQERISKANQLAQGYEQQLGEARKQSQAILATAQSEAQKLATEKIAQAQQEAQRQKEAAAQEIEEQKQAALRTLEAQVDGLSRQILEKLLGSELVK